MEKLNGNTSNESDPLEKSKGYDFAITNKALEFEPILQSQQPQKDEFIPMPIYRRPKDDSDEELKESSLKPQQYHISKMHTLSQQAVPNSKLFENIEVLEICKRTAAADDDEIENEEQALILCPVLRRLVAVLNYYNSLMINKVDKDSLSLQISFVEFCDKHYGAKWMMEDHIHFVVNHSDLKSTNKIVSALDWTCFGDLKRCSVTTRHYRDRSLIEDAVHFYIETMDKLHYHTLHLVDVGLRVDSKNSFEQNQNEDSLVDQNVLKIVQQIHRKRQQTAFPRIDATAKNSKFSLCSNVESNDCAKGGVTKMDSVLKDFQKEVGDEAAVHRLVEFMEEQQYDTETMNEDIAVYAESKQCNVRKAMEAQGDGEEFGAVRKWLRYHRVSGSSFSTGKWWAYWPWYWEQTSETMINLRSFTWDRIDFGGHSIESLCVHPYFQNLKEEAMGSGLISAKFWKSLIDKATRYLKSSKCKKMVDEYGDGNKLKFGVPVCFKVTLEHLLSLLLYTDSSEYCTALSETFRAIKSGETIEEMNGRNSMYYWTSKNLKELVYCFGGHAANEKRPFFTGLSFEINIPQFQIGLVGPTSTSLAKEVAVRFAGEKGTLVVLKGGSSKCFDASFVSAYPEEEERIFIGSRFRETVSSIILVNSAKNYKKAIGAYSKFDAIFSGRKIDKMSALEIEIITESLRWINGGDDAENHKMLDLFILETFYSFIIHKKMIYLMFGHLYFAKENDIVNTVMNPLWNKMKDGLNNKPANANLMKSFVLSLFRDVHQITIWAGNYYPFDLVLFLAMIRSVEVPETLKIIIIEGRKWIDDQFNDKVAAEYAAEGIVAEKENNDGFWSLKLKF